MQAFVDGLIGRGAVPAGVPVWAVYLGAMLVFGGVVVFGFVLPIAGITTWVERRIMGRMQSLIGPSRTGPSRLCIRPMSRRSTQVVMPAIGSTKPKTTTP